MAEELKLNKASCKKYQDNFKNNYQDFIEVANKIAETADLIPNAWKGEKSAKFCSQWDGFEPNMTITYNILAKTRRDFKACIENIESADES